MDITKEDLLRWGYTEEEAERTLGHLAEAPADPHDDTAELRFARVFS